MKQGLILEGGAMRGMFTAGVTDVMMEHGITFDGMIGVSAGAAFGCNYKSKQIGRVIRYNMRFCKDPRYCGMRSLIRTGDIFGAAFCWHTIPDELDPFDVKTFNENPMEFYAVCTDVETGKAFYHKCETADPIELDWMRASASMPIVSRPVVLEGRMYLDGGIADSIPLRFFEHIGYEQNVIILTQPEGYAKQKAKFAAATRLALRKYPALVHRMERRYIHYNKTLRYIREAEEAGRAFVVRPPEKLPIGHIEHDPLKLRAVYDIGRATGEAQVEAMKIYLGQTGDLAAQAADTDTAAVGSARPINTDASAVDHAQRGMQPRGNAGGEEAEE